MLVLKLKSCFPLCFCSRGWGGRSAPTSHLEQGLDQLFLSAEPREILAGVWQGQGSKEIYFGWLKCQGEDVVAGEVPRARHAPVAAVEGE